MYVRACVRACVCVRACACVQLTTANLERVMDRLSEDSIGAALVSVAPKTLTLPTRAKISPAKIDTVASRTIGAALVSVAPKTLYYTDTSENTASRN